MGAPVVIAIATTAVTSFISPFVSDAIALLRWYLLILASFLGGLGLCLGLITIFIHLASLKSFGSPYLAPIAPIHRRDLKDALVKYPAWMMQTRPRALNPQDIKRQDVQKPDFVHDID